MDFDFTTSNFGAEPDPFADLDRIIYPDGRKPEGLVYMPPSTTQTPYPPSENISDSVASCSQDFGKATDNAWVSEIEGTVYMPPSMTQTTYFPSGDISDLVDGCLREFDKSTNPAGVSEIERTVYMPPSTTQTAQSPSGDISDLVNGCLKEFEKSTNPAGVSETYGTNNEYMSDFEMCCTEDIEERFEKHAVPETEGATEMSPSTSRANSISSENSSGVSTDWNNNQSALIENTKSIISEMDPLKAKFRVLAGKKKLYKTATFSCPKCDYSSFFRDELKRHFRSNHTTPRIRQILPNTGYLKMTATNNDNVKTPNLHALEDFLHLPSTRKSPSNAIHPIVIRIVNPIEQSSEPMEQSSEPMEQLSEPMEQSDSTNQEVDVAIDDFFVTYYENKKKEIEAQKSSVPRADLATSRERSDKVIIFPSTLPSGVVRSCGRTNSFSSTTVRGVVGQKKVNRIKLHKCSGCNLAFTSPSHLLHHFRMKHTSVRLPVKIPEGKFSTALICPRCPRRFPNNILLIQHMKFGHNFENLPCKACSFVTPSDLEYESHFHANPSHLTVLMTCSTCRFESESKRVMEDHIREHMKIRILMANLPPYEKGEVFVYRSTKETEELRKKAFACEKCTFSAPTIEEGMNHLRSAHDVRCFECANCKARTPSESGMLKHFHRFNHKPSGCI